MVRSEGIMSLKNQVTPPGINPGTIQLVATTPPQAPHAETIWNLIQQSLSVLTKEKRDALVWS